MSVSIRHRLGVFDDAALEGLANRGLLRRAAKDIESGKVAIERESDAEVVVAADGEYVTLDARGPRFARCTCPAVGVCRHKLAATLLLRPLHATSASGGDAGGASVSTEPATSARTADPLREVETIPVEALIRWAGRATLQAAVELLAGARPEVEVNGGSLSVRIGANWPPILYLAGQGLDGIVSKVAPPRHRLVHTAAVLAVWQLGGRDVASLTEPPPEATSRAPPDAEFLAGVKTALEGAVGLAFTDAPQVLEEQLFVLSLSSRADDLPALSRRLRQISGSIRARRGRDHALLPDAMMSAIATAHAQCDALANCSDPSILARLRGVVRQGYAPVGHLTLYGLAARTWETRGGGRGVTGYLYCEQLRRVVSVSLSRANAHDSMFDSTAAYDGETLWRTGALREMMGARVDLQQARLSPDGRLSLSQETIGLLSGWAASVNACADWPFVFDDWRRLEASLRDRLALSLTAEREGAFIVGLAPAAHQPAAFDPIAQATVLMLRDAAGRALGLTLPNSAATPGAGEILERVSKQQKPEMVFAEVIPGPGHIALRALSTIAHQAEVSTFTILDASLTRASAPHHVPRSGDTPHVGGIESDGEDEIAPAGAPISRSAHGALVAEIQATLLRMAELGLRPSEEASRTFLAFSARARQVGLGVLAEACRRVSIADPATLPGTMLRAWHICDRILYLDRDYPVVGPTMGVVSG